MESSGPRKKKIVNKKNDLMTKLQKKIKKKIKKKVKRSEKRSGGLNGNRQCRKNDVPEPRRLRIKGAPGHEGMFLKGLRTKYISRKTLNEANEARKNEDINKIIDIGRVFRKGGKESGGQKSRAETTARPVFNTDATIILQENKNQQDEQIATAEKKKSNVDKKLFLLSLLYEERIGSQLLPRLTEHDVLEEAFGALRMNEKKSEKDEALENEFVKEFKFLTENSQPEIPLAEIFGKDFHDRNHARSTGNRSRDICTGFRENPTEDDSIHLLGVGICEGDPAFTSSPDDKRRKSQEFETKDFEKHRDLNITTPQIQFYRRNMF